MQIARNRRIPPYFDVKAFKKGNTCNFRINHISEKVVVTALYAFKAQNTDELSFAKNDMIVLTQAPADGGWWEGTLNNKTGWFPSNYVEQVVKKADSSSSLQSRNSQQCAEMYQNRETTIQTLNESEQHYISDLDNFILRTLQPLANALITSNSTPLHLDFDSLDELLKFHHHLSNILNESIQSKHYIGALFLQLASGFKSIFEVYCYQHAKILFLFNNHKDRILNGLSKIDPYFDNNTYVQLIKNLSLPLNRLDRYASFLKEYLYNLEEFHVDRGDAQRATEYYTELISFAAQWRKRKEWELDIVNSSIHGFDTDSLKSYGDALCISSVNILTEHNGTQVSLERIAILYPSTLFLLSTSSNQQEYHIENRYQINQITISKIIDISKRALKINVPLSPSLVITYPNPIEYQEWCEKLYAVLTAKSHSLQQTQKSQLPFSGVNPSNSGNVPVRFPIKIPHWSKGCLRPHSPLRILPSTGTSIRTASPIPLSNLNMSEISSNSNENSSSRTLKRFMSMKKSKAQEFLKRVETSEGDSLLLSVIEGYCVTTTSSGTAITAFNNVIPKKQNSIQGTINRTQSITPTTTTNAERRTMYEMLCELRLAYKSLQKELEEEKRARKQLDSQIQKLLLLTPAKGSFTTNNN
ncbi:unnamed protein product [Rotaria magnacalcarata]|uniref:Rho guanine nucleotide exchange factor 7 n=5 Tax=Rotaria magnacalcarata TaxID=392030 RepID=A0A816RB97_9BILA|nr:unnamed protein product [Rotaria magnacalcarata]CAF1672230.1 unnamed protein product [Rotaria magnacalcarata]CAF2071782.1 unnamed protein product [Rotaria magnacalcarata]